MDATRSTVVMLRYISAPAVKKVWERTSAKCKKTQGDMSHCRQPSVPRWLRHYTQCSVTSYYHRSTLTSLMHSTVSIKQLPCVAANLSLFTRISRNVYINALKIITISVNCSPDKRINSSMKLHVVV